MKELTEHEVSQLISWTVDFQGVAGGIFVVEENLKKANPEYVSSPLKENELERVRIIFQELKTQIRERCMVDPSQHPNMYNSRMSVEYYEHCVQGVMHSLSQFSSINTALVREVFLG